MEKIVYSNLPDKTKAVLDDIRDELEVPFLNHNIVNPQRDGTMASTAIAFSLLSQATLITPEMGLGKTYIAMGVVKEVLQLCPNKKILFCGPNDKLIEYQKDFEYNLPEYKITSTSASGNDIRISFGDLLAGADILICGHSVFNKGVDFHLNLIPMLDRFSTFILDEGSMLLKSEDSYAYRSMEQFVPKMQYRYVLDATPIQRDLQLLINTCRILGVPIPTRNKIYREYGTITGEHNIIFNNLDQLKDELKYHMFNVSRNQLEIAGDIYFDIDVRLLDVPPRLEKWIEEYGVRNLRYPFFDESLFQERYYPSLMELKRVCMKGRANNEKMLVYVRNVNPKKEMKRELEELGLSVGIYDGTHTNDANKKYAVEQAFNNGKYDVLLTNKLYGLSLPIANHLIFYDFPPNFFQFVFRAIRTLGQHNLKLTSIMYDHRRDLDRMTVELNSERYQNEFVDREFSFVSEMIEIIDKKRSTQYYDG